MTRTTSIGATVLLAALLAGSSACGGKKKPEAGLWKPDEVDVTAAGSVLVFTEPEKFEQKIGMRAVADPDGTILVSIQNDSDRPLEVHPRMFAVITGPNKATDTVRPGALNAEMSRFTTESLPAGGTTVAAFRLNAVADPRGMRLVMQDPSRNLMFFVDIE